jgi:CheY-like chemotaxis protein
MTLPSILMIDDDDDSTFLVKYWVEKEHLCSAFTTVLNGEEALYYLKKNPSPNFIVLDINMPRMNGWEFLSEYRKQISNPSSKIIVVSVSENPKDKLKADTLNIGYIQKPLTLEILKKIFS